MVMLHSHVRLPAGNPQVNACTSPFYKRNQPHETGWWYTYPSEKYEFVSWDDEIPN